jgi:CBS domain-containing protein
MDATTALPTRLLGAGTSLAHARPWQTHPVTLDSSALDVMTDLTLTKAATASPGTLLHQAEQVMIYQGVRMLFVVSNMPVIEGLITTTDLQGDRPMRVVQQRGLRHDELTVGDIMTPLAMLDAIALADLQHARVAHVIATLIRHGRNHLLVTDTATDGSAAPRVRGVLSRAQIERQLGRTIEVPEIAHSFAELGQMLS